MSLLLIGLALALLWAVRDCLRWRLAAAAGAVLLCAYAGLTLPDLDHPLPVDHRSALTHSALPALLLGLRRWARPAAAGAGFGTGLHLSADAFPNAMIGYATVKLPFAGSIGADASYAWLGINALLCLIVGARLLGGEIGHRGVRLAVFAAVIVMAALYLFSVDGGWPPLALLCASLLLLWRRQPGIGGLQRAADWATGQR